VRKQYHYRGDENGVDAWDEIRGHFPLPEAKSASDLEPGRRIELLTYALRVRAK
jgi:hypothetical protein